jgi:enamine deaminase RidA (YjgF/YER057c/UK114 family)
MFGRFSKYFVGAIFLLAHTLGSALAQDVQKDLNLPQHIPSPNGEVVLASPFDEQVYREDHFSSIRRAGDYIFFSGVAMGAHEPIDAVEFESRCEKLFLALKLKVEASGATLGDVVSIHSYHAWHSPYFSGTREEENAAFERAKDAFFKPPYPTWTAVGVQDLYDDHALVEVELMAYAPRRH